MPTLVVTGATGLLGPYVVEEGAREGHQMVAVGGPTREGGIDLADRAATSQLIARTRPDAVIHTAALSAMADCARDVDLARRLNVEATANLARCGVRLVHVSTDLVFDGEHAPYSESARAAPSSVYGRTKLESEGEVVNGIVVRASLLFGPSHSTRRGFFDTQLASLRRGEILSLFDDEWRTPLSLRAAAEALVAVATSATTGILHLGGPERMSRHDMGVRLARTAGLAEGSIRRISRTSAQGEPRPRDVSLDSSAFHRAFPGIATGSFEAECARMLKDQGSRGGAA